MTRKILALLCINRKYFTLNPNALVVGGDGLPFDFGIDRRMAGPGALAVWLSVGKWEFGATVYLRRIG